MESINGFSFGVSVSTARWSLWEIRQGLCWSVALGLPFRIFCSDASTQCLERPSHRVRGLRENHGERKWRRVGD